MTAIKLPKLPERTPVKLVIHISPELHQTLNAYAELYCETYGSKELVVDLVPHMLAAFLMSDRAFSSRGRGGERP